MREPEDGVEWGANLVVHHRHEPRLGLAVPESLFGAVLVSHIANDREETAHAFLGDPGHRRLDLAPMAILGHQRRLEVDYRLAAREPGSQHLRELVALGGGHEIKQRG